MTLWPSGRSPSANLDPPSDAGDSPPTWQRVVRRGAAAGVYATAVMTVFRLPISHSLPPTAEFWAQYVGDGRPADYPLVGLVLHVIYGAVGGAVLAPVVERLARGPNVRRERRGALLGFVYGAVLSAVGRLLLLKGLLGMDLDPDERWIFLVSHLIYGLSLGSWLGSRSP